VSQCNTFEGKKIKLNLELEKKSYAALMVFSDLWAGRAVKTTLAPKFGGPAQRWGKAGLGKGGAGWNPGPSFPRLTPPSPSSPLPPPFPLGLPASKAKGEGRRKGRGDKWGEGGPGLGGGGAWVGSMHHPLPWLPPQRYAKIGSF
jgi:hypothetical protein